MTLAQVKKKAGTQDLFRKRPIQLHLDAGQRDFHLTRCAVCAMMYARGEASDERLHKVHHATFLQEQRHGIKFTGWSKERVVLDEGALGRIVAVLPTDTAQHLAKANELCARLEQVLGLASGWLVGRPSSRPPPALHDMSNKRVRRDDSHGSGDLGAVKRAQAEQQTGQQAVRQAGQQQVGQHVGQRQAGRQAGQRRIFLHVSTDRRVTGVVVAEPLQRAWRTAAAPCQLAAAAVGHVSADHVSTSSATASHVGASHVSTSCGTSTAVQPLGPMSSAVAGVSCAPACSTGTMKRTCDPSSICAPVASDRHDTMSPSASGAPVAASAPHRPADPPADSAPHLGRPGVPPAVTSDWQDNTKQVACGQTVAAPVSHRPAESPSGTAPHQGQVAPAVPPAALQAVASAAPAAATLMLMPDRSKAATAMCGVRYVWVCPQLRRRGVAQKMLDVVRCHMVHGYVVPRSLVAFSQPTAAGAKLAAAFSSGADRVLLYDADDGDDAK